MIHFSLTFYAKLPRLEIGCAASAFLVLQARKILPAMEKSKQLTINLFKRKNSASLEVFLHWAITGGRFIVILTETIALIAFLYRFNLDRQIVDLHDKIKAKQAIVSALAPKEQSYRQLQQRIAKAKDIQAGVIFMPTLFTKIADLVQLPVRFTTLTMSEESLHIEITCPSVNDLKAFVNKLKGQKELVDISIDSIEDKTSTAELSVVLSAKVVGAPQSEAILQTTGGTK